MPVATIPEVTLTPVAYFPQCCFLENLAIRRDSSVPISSLLHKERGAFKALNRASTLNPSSSISSTTSLWGIVEAEPEIFIASLSEVQTCPDGKCSRSRGHDVVVLPSLWRDGGDDFDGGIS